MSLKIGSCSPNTSEFVRYQDLLRLLIEDLKRTSKPGKMMIETRKSGVYYKFTLENRRWYINKKDQVKLKKYLQIDYNNRVLKTATNQLEAITRFLNSFHPDELEQIYSDRPAETKLLISPYAVSNEDYAAAWLAKQHKTRKAVTEYVTSKGEYVRSKSEVIIADTLASLGIPYKYEPELVTKSDGLVYPDFLILDANTRKEIYYEHFGKMNDPEYVKRTLTKLDAYAKEGIILGNNFIATFESEDHPLNRNTVVQTLSQFVPINIFNG